MNNILNGTTWGEIPQNELNIPPFMLQDQSWRETDRRITDMELANRSAAVGRARRKMRAKNRQEYEAKKNFRLGLALVSVPALMLMLVAYLVEMIV